MSDVKFFILLLILSLVFNIICSKIWKLSRSNFLTFFWGWKMHVTWSCLGMYSLGVKKIVHGVFSRGECLFKLQRRKKVPEGKMMVFSCSGKKNENHLTRVCPFRLSETNLVWRSSLKLQLWVMFKLYKLEVKGTFWKSIQQHWDNILKRVFQVVACVSLSHMAYKWEVFVRKVFCNDFVYDWVDEKSTLLVMTKEQVEMTSPLLDLQFELGGRSNELL